MKAAVYKPQLNKISTVQECDATMLDRGQMLVTQKKNLK